MMQDVHQIEVFRIPLCVELTELMEMKVTLKMDCAAWLRLNNMRRHICLVRDSIR